MLFALNQVQNCNLELMEEIPDAFFNSIETSADYGFHMFPAWFKTERGAQTNGLYGEGLNLFNLIKASGREADIVKWYTDYKNIDQHSRDTTTTVNYLTAISQELHDAAKTFFSSLYKAFDSFWFTEYANIDVRKYIRDFKKTNDVYFCPICGVETIPHGSREARSALDHWFCKAKYPFLGVYLNNLIPMGAGCNNPPRKGEKELIYTDNSRSKRQEFYYPFVYDGEVEVILKCLREPTNIEDDCGEWVFQFKGVNAEHQALIDRWSSFFEISARWIEEVLELYVLSWTNEVVNVIRESQLEIDNESSYRKAIEFLQSTKKELHTSPFNRVQWHFLEFMLTTASVGLFEAYRSIVKENLIFE
jgi:hypothetical protein